MLPPCAPERSSEALVSVLFPTCFCSAIDNHEIVPLTSADALQVAWDVEILQREFGPAHFHGLRAVLLDHPLPTAIAIQRAQLRAKGSTQFPETQSSHSKAYVQHGINLRLARRRGSLVNPHAKGQGPAK